MANIIKDIGKVLKSIYNDFKDIDEKRELLIKINRELLQLSTNATFHILHNENKSYLGELRAAKKLAVYIIKLISTSPSLHQQYLVKVVHEGLREYVEALLLYKYVNNRRRIKISTLISIANVCPSAVIEGIFDFIGELRRIFLEKLMEDKIEDAKRIITDIRSMYEQLMKLNIRNYYISAYKRRIDGVRGILDKSMEDLYIALTKRGAS